MTEKIKNIEGKHLKDYISSFKACRFDNNGCILEPRFGRIEINLSCLKGIKRCELYFKRESGNGAFVFKNGENNCNLKVVSKIKEKINVDINESQTFEILRPQNSSGNISLLRIILYLNDKDNFDDVDGAIMNWKKLLDSCSRYKNLKIANGKLYASFGAFIEGCTNLVDLRTHPPRKYKVTGNRISFLTACEIISFSLDPSSSKSLNEKHNLYNHRNKPKPVLPKYEDKNKRSKTNDLAPLLGNYSSTNQERITPSYVIYDTITANGLVSLQNSAVTPNLVKSFNSKNKLSLVLCRGAVLRVTIATLLAGYRYSAIISIKKLTGNGKVVIGVIDVNRKVVVESTIICHGQLKDQKILLDLGSIQPYHNFSIQAPFRLEIRRPSDICRGDVLISRLVIIKDSIGGYQSNIPVLDYSFIGPEISSATDNVDLGLHLEKNYGGDVIYATAKKFARYLSNFKPHIKFNQYNTVLSITTSSGLNWYNKIRQFCPGVKIVSPSCKKSDNKLLIGACGVLVPTKRIWIDVFNQNTIPKGQLNILSQSKIIYSPCEPNVRFLKDKFPDISTQLKCKPLFASKPIRDTFFDKNTYVLMFYRGVKSIEFLIKNWNKKLPKILLIGGRGNFPDFIIPANEYLPYNNLLYAIEKCKYILDFSGGVEFISSFLNMSNFFKVPILSSNPWIKSKSNSFYFDESKKNFEEMLNKVMSADSQHITFNNLDFVNLYNKKIIEDYNIL